MDNTYYATSSGSRNQRSVTARWRLKEQRYEIAPPKEKGKQIRCTLSLGVTSPMLSLRVATPGNLLVSKLAHSETSKAKLSYGQSKASIGTLRQHILEVHTVVPNLYSTQHLHPNRMFQPREMPTSNAKRFWCSSCVEWRRSL